MSVAIVMLDTKRDVAQLPADVASFVRIGRPWSSVPAGWREVPGGSHMGRGIWIIRYERVPCA